MSVFYGFSPEAASVDQEDFRVVFSEN